jgi:hypothetical protein
MDSLFPGPMVASSTYTHVTPLGVALICVLLLLAFYMFFINKKFVPAAAGMGNMARWTERSAGFQSGYEPPIFWGTGGGKELTDWNLSNVGGTAETETNFDPKNMDPTSFNKKNNLYGTDVNAEGRVTDNGAVVHGASTKAWFSGKYSDAHLAGKLGQ